MSANDKSNVVQLPDRTGYATRFMETYEGLDAFEDALRSVGCRWDRGKIVRLVQRLHAGGFEIARIDSVPDG